MQPPLLNRMVTLKLENLQISFRDLFIFLRQWLGPDQVVKHFVTATL